MLARVPAKAVDAVTTFLVGRYGVTEACARYQAEYLLNAVLDTGTLVDVEARGTNFDRSPPARPVADELARLRQDNEDLTRSVAYLGRRAASQGRVTRQVIADLQTALKAAHTALGELP